jgi:site-specific DNA-methyltransferase (adenine-specific)
MELDRIYNMDCLEGMRQIPDGTIDAVICDLPYGTTACAWDVIIPFDLLWEQYNRIVKPGGAIVLFGSEPFSTYLRMSNIKHYKYDWIWDKTFGRQPMLSNIQPMKQHEIISVFSMDGGKVLYNPQRVKLAKPYHSKGAGNNAGSKNDHKLGLKQMAKTYTESTPTSIISMAPIPNGENIHPTQKPVDLLRYLVLTYTNEGDTVLDNCMGSGTTAIACIKERRHFIGFELNKEYYDKACKRIKAEQAQLTLF